MQGYEVDPYPIGWYFVAFSDALAEQSVARLHYFGQEVVLYRGASGAPQATEAYCPHQGAHLGWGGTVQDDDIVCPFHGWRFGSDGANVSIPYAPRDCDALLQTWPTRELDGMIFLWYHPDHEAPTWEPQPVPEFNDPNYPPTWRSEPIELTVHPQDTFENGVDAAHFVSVHRGYGMPSVNIVVNDGPHFVAEMPDQKLRSDRGPFDANVSSDYWGLGIDIARMKSSFLSIVYVMLQTPIDEKTIRVWFHTTVQRLGSADPGSADLEWVAKIGQGIVTEFLQDKVIWDHKIYRPAPRLAPVESPVHTYRQWAQQFYAAQTGNLPAAR